MLVKGLDHSFTQFPATLVPVWGVTLSVPVVLNILLGFLRAEIFIVPRGWITLTDGLEAFPQLPHLIFVGSFAIINM